MNTENISELNIKSLIQMAVQKHQLGQWSEAESIYRSIYNQISQTQHDDQVTKNSLEDLYHLIVLNYGDVLQNQGKFHEATQIYKQALSLDPNFAQVYNDLGNIFFAQGKLEAAVASYQQALKIQPDLALPHNNLGNIFQELNQLEAAINCYQKALKITPNWADAHYNLGNALKGQGQLEDAVASYQQALNIKPNYDLAKFGICMTQLPIIYTNVDEVQLRRNQYQQHLQNLAHHYQIVTAEERADAAEAIGSLQPFYLAYQGYNDRHLQQIYGEMICQLMSSRYPQYSQLISLPNLQANEKVRVGFLTGYFRDHSCWKLMKGWIENLDKSEFELFGYHTGSQQDQETVRAAKAFDKFTQGPLPIEKWAEIVEQDKLHILIFLEFGMDPMTVRLGCLRLAPIQMTSWSHPETSGLPTIDYYLTSDLMEPENAQDHYTEKLVRLPNLGIYYTALEIQSPAITKQDIGIADDDIMFWCCQSLFKYLPQHDDVFPRIAKELDNCKFVFIEHPASKRITEIFRQRLSLVFEEFGLNYQNHCIFMPHMDTRTFDGTTAIADVFLDSIGWSGGNTTLEAIAHNIPVMTFPGEMMRGRHTMAILKMMGIEEMIAATKDEYVKIAVRLGQDTQYRQYISQQVAENKPKIYGDLKPVRALEEFLLKLVNKPRRFGTAETSEILQLAVQYQRANRLVEAEQLYRQILEKHPEHPEALFSLGMLAQQLGQTKSAENWLSAACQFQPDSVKIWFSLGNLRLAQEQFSEAVIAYRQALALRPDSLPIYNNLGYALQQKKLFDEAINCYQKALELKPDFIETDANLGNALHAQGKLSNEQKLYYAQLNNKLGNARKKSGDLQTAELYFQKALELNPNYGEVYTSLGEIDDSQHNLKEKI
ncbi:tetratricopeptide repeat protein [Anabaena sp. WFMT]|uniref:tetratricopeptide repeat protein n=1 Tax=Anabaena sp. WFMT TaxID=3449730 RepID=UPI003F2403AD